MQNTMTDTRLQEFHQQNWYEVCEDEDLPVLSARQVQIKEKAIAIIKTVDGQVYAVDDSCPHRQGSLSEGMVYGNFVSCPLHAWSFNLSDGKARAPDSGRISCYGAKVEEGKIWVAVR